MSASSASHKTPESNGKINVSRRAEETISYLKSIEDKQWMYARNEPNDSASRRHEELARSIAVAREILIKIGT